jgi:hypothetical protein
VSVAIPEAAVPAAGNRLAVEHLMGAPLDQLFAEFGVGVSVLEADPAFAGGVYVRKGGSMLFVRPAGRPEAEWELTARAMLGAALRVSLPPLPAPYELTEF